MTVVAIHQPQYVPWLPYCDKADSCDIFVYLDNVQFMRRGVQNRNQIKTPKGAAWLTVPVSAAREDKIQHVRIATGRDWQKDHILTIEHNYARAACFELFGQGLKPLLERSWDYLVDVNIAVTDWMFAQLGVQCLRVRASELDVTGAKDDLIISICQAVGATVYLSGQGAKAYQDEGKFRQHGIELRYHQYRSQPYRQCFSETGFVPDLSALDLILNLGDEARAVMLAGRLP